MCCYSLAHDSAIHYIWIRMCHCLVYATPWHNHNWALTWYSTTMAIAHGSALVLMLLECMERNDKWLRAVVDWILWNGIIPCCFWTYREYVGAYLNWNVSLFGVRCTMTPSRSHTRLLLNYNGNHTRLCTDALYMIWSQFHTLFWHWLWFTTLNDVVFGSGSTGRKLVLMRVWIWMCHYLVYNIL